MHRPLLHHALTLLLAATPAATGVAQNISAEQRAALERGEHVMIVEDRPSSPWPAITVFRLIDATPEQATAVFIDYDAHHQYIPSLVSSRVSKRLDAATAEVDYVLDVPVVRDERYTVRDHVSRDSTGAYRVTWTLVRATSTKATSGYCRFSAYTYSRAGAARTATLVEYHNFVVPGSRLAGLGFVRTRALRQSEQTVEAMRRRTAEIQRDRAAMSRAEAALSAAIAPR